MIDLRSDTQTKPTKPMREAMAKADVGDEQLGEDSCVTSLCERTAELLGQEAAIFLPSGIMCNQIAACVHCRPGDEILTACNAHILQAEGGFVAANAQAIVTPIPTECGIFSVDDLSKAIRIPKTRAPRPRMLSVEQTTNRGGGAIWPVDVFHDIALLARSRKLAVHLDGARLINAVVATGVEARDFVGQTDSCWIDLTKGLGCPIGAVLAGNRDIIREAWYHKNRFGGAMRQAGIAAAAGLHALSHHVERLVEDHQNASLLAQLIGELPVVSFPYGKVETNIVIFDLDHSLFRREPDIFCSQLSDRGVQIRCEGEARFRAITHLDVNEDQVREAAAVIGEVLEAQPQS